MICAERSRRINKNSYLKCEIYLTNTNNGQLELSYIASNFSHHHLTIYIPSQLQPLLPHQQAHPPLKDKRQLLLVVAVWLSFRKFLEYGFSFICFSTLALVLYIFLWLQFHIYFQYGFNYVFSIRKFYGFLIVHMYISLTYMHKS